MGKIRRNKGRIPKISPIGTVAKEDMESELWETEFPVEGPIHVIVEQLQSPNADEKMNGLQTLNILATKKDKISEICVSDILRITAPFLVDANPSLRNASAAALRNLSTGGVEVCECMVEEDVLTPLLTLLKEYACCQDWVPTFEKSFNNQLDEKSDTFLHATNLLWNLCESTSVALNTFNQSHLLESFLRCLDYKTFGLDISITVARCLLVISEDNPTAWDVFSKFITEFIYLFNIQDGHQHTLLRTLAAGIISNIPCLATSHFREIITVASKTLEINHIELLKNAATTLLLNKEQDAAENVSDADVVNMTEESEEEAHKRRQLEDQPTQAEMEVKLVECILEAQRLAAEIITNMCCENDEECQDNNSEDGSEECFKDSDSSHCISINDESIDKLLAQILDTVKSFGLVAKLWKRAQLIDDNTYQVFRENHQTTLKKIENLRISTFFCIQNLCNFMTIEDLGGPNAIYGVWLNLGEFVFQKTQDPVILEAATSLMRATLKHLENCPHLFKQVTENDLQLMLNGVRNYSVPEIRANWLRMLGILGRLLSNLLSKIIIEFIVDTCLEEDDVWTMSEGIDSLMDMFCDDDDDDDEKQIPYDRNLIQKLKDLEKILKKKLRLQKMKLKARYPAVTTVRLNLSRFIKYLEEKIKTKKSTVA